VLDTCSALVLKVEGLENANAAQQLEILELLMQRKKYRFLLKMMLFKSMLPRKLLLRLLHPPSLHHYHHLLSFHLHLLTNYPVHLNHKLQTVHLMCFSRDPEEELHIDTPAETPIVKDKGKGILIEDPKPMKKKDQI
nr:hypothetical protein [Tanacetum cinerariifolium]